MTFKCGVHNFTTEKIEDWFKHQEEEEHTISGVSACKICGFSTSFEFKGKVKGDSIPAICDKCRKSL